MSTEHIAAAPAGASDWAGLYDAHVRRLRGLAAAITFDPSTADEIVQDAYAGLIARGDRVERPVAYLQRSVINLSINAVRRRRRFDGLPKRRDPIVEPTAVDEVWAVIARLTPRQRAVVVLRFYEDQSIEQIAELLDLPLGTVKSTLHRALAALKEQLS
jgi:RNA polymerase sigma factor (sigma-70 family)